MVYIDCYLVPVPRANKLQYENLAKISADVMREYGALRIVECWLDEAGPDASSYHAESARDSVKVTGTFINAAGAKHDETVVISWIEWPDKKSRDAGMEKIMADPRVQFEDVKPVFDGSRIIAAGFLPLLDNRQM